MLGIPRPFYSGVSNERVMEAANQRMHLAGGKTIVAMSTKLRNRQIKFLGHLIRASEEDLTRTCAFTNQGRRVRAGWKRVGRPRLKWYDTVVNMAIKLLVEKYIIPTDWENHMRRDEAINLVIQAAESRELEEI